MLELAIDGSAAFSISLVDIERPGWSFTSDSLRMLREVFDSSVELYFLMGQDSLRDFPNWNQPDLIVRHARLGVALRPGVTVSVADVVQRVPAARDRIELVDVPLIGISSRALRDEIARGGPFRFQVVPAVADYIEQHGLYRTGATATSVPREIG
jgi:nicotinate-nucleotide adenylyltransferase